MVEVIIRDSNFSQLEKLPYNTSTLYILYCNKLNEIKFLPQCINTIYIIGCENFKVIHSLPFNLRKIHIKLCPVFQFIHLETPNYISDINIKDSPHFQITKSLLKIKKPCIIYINSITETNNFNKIRKRQKNFKASFKCIIAKIKSLSVIKEDE